MKISEFLEKNQQIPDKIFKNCLTSNKYFQGYLLSGSLGTPLFEVAIFLAKSMLCKNHNPYACENCPDCLKVSKNSHENLIILDGHKNNIKKDEINEIITRFSSTSSSYNQARIYIINEIENMSADASNALLKFLEEPPKNVYAIFTTLNKFKILPTILSRLEKIEFSLLDQNYLIEESTKLGVNVDDAELLSFFYNDPSLIETISKDENYIESKTDLLELFKNLKNKKNLRFFIESNLVSKLKTKEEIRYFYDNLTIFIKEVLKYKINESTILSSYVNIIKDIINNVDNLENAVITVVNDRNEISYNLVTSLLLIHTLSTIFEV